jgi:hypothetical protein
MAVSPELQEFVDSLTEEKYNVKIAELDLAKLKELAQEYNAKLETEEEDQDIIDEKRIDLRNTDKLELIVLLWQRDIDIPSYLNLTWGEPYDTTFKRVAKLAPQDYGGETYNEEDSFLYQLLMDQKGLGQYVGSAVDFHFGNETQKLIRLNNILAELGISPITGRDIDLKIENYYSIVKDMIPLAKVYVALRLQEDYDKYTAHVHLHAILKPLMPLDLYLQTRNL